VAIKSEKRLIMDNVEDKTDLPTDDFWTARRDLQKQIESLKQITIKRVEKNE